MSIKSTFFKIGIITIWILLIPLVATGQTARKNTVQEQQQPKIRFSKNISQSNREMNWSRTYYLSFQKTNETIYLKLSADHCANAIRVLRTTQDSFPNTTPFYYKAKNKRVIACRFYNSLQETALRLGPDHYIYDLSDNGCDF